MKKQDIHVLNWERITQNINTSSGTNKTTNKTDRMINKGILFEDLIEKLLVAMFPNETWRRTIESHDGKRDFVYPKEESFPDQKWAECKNYSNNLSLNIIAPTLIMGAIENIESIFIFSYSPLNDNAIEGILNYSKTSKRKVELFDGNVLESLICKFHNINGIADFFPNTDFEKAYSVLKNKKLRIIKIIKDINGNKISASHLFELGEFFYIYMIVQNLTYEQVNCRISIKNNKEHLIKSDISIGFYTLPFAGIGEYSIQCQTLNPGNLNCKLRITVENSEKTFSTNQKIRIIDEQHLFWIETPAFKILDRCRTHLESYSSTSLLIAAESGMGKSTLINILSQEKNIYEKYKILKIDLNLTRNCCIKNIFTLIVGLHDNEKTPKDQKKDENEAFSLLMGNYAENAEMIAETMMKLYDTSHPYLFVIDDAQKIDRAYITLFNELNERAEKEDKPIYYMLALNENECSVDTLLSRLNWDVENHEHKCELVGLNKFGRNDIVSFMQHKYGLKDLDKYFENFDKEIRPLDIHRLCMNLKSEKIITSTPNSKEYIIVDFFKFHEMINHIYTDISLKNICSSFGKGDDPEYVLKYLYITDKIDSQMRKKWADIINQLITFGILKEIDGSIAFYHDEIRNLVGEKIFFSEEDYADIYKDKNLDDTAKSLCALNQIGRIRDSIPFLKNFFCSYCQIQKKSHRYEICWLIFENLNQLTENGLTVDALRFVKANFALLNAEQGHSSFLNFLKHIADSALINRWDTDSDSIENMAYFIKKFFDRSLSTYNYQSCSEYFKKFQKVFMDITNISSSRRYFWLSHFANRVAIALDRSSVPLCDEPCKVSEMYALSERYCIDAGNDNELLLQITIDNFNRHYVYRHDLTVSIVQNTYNFLTQMSLKKSMLLEYHLLLLEYLTLKMNDKMIDYNKYNNLLKKVDDISIICQSSFYRLKLYMLKIYIFIELRRLSDAETLLKEAFEFAYRRDMRSYIYKLTYIKAHILIFQADTKAEADIQQQIFLAFRQLMEQRNDAPNDLMREIFLVVRMAHFINEQELYASEILPKSLSDGSCNLLREVYGYIKGQHTEHERLFGMQSYFTFNKISFPNI